MKNKFHWVPFFRVLFFLGLFLGVFHSLPSRAAVDAETLGRQADGLVHPFMEEYNVSRIGLVFISGDTTLVRSYGQVETFDLASITKTFTAGLIAQAIEENKLSLDTKLTDLFPEFKINPALATIKIRCLLTNTSGLPRDIPTFIKDREGFYRYMRSSLKSSAMGPGGDKQYRYSNLGVALLGLSLERVYKKPYTTLAQERILMPLGMKNSFFSADEKFPGTQGLQSTVEDMSLYLKAHMTRQEAIYTKQHQNMFCTDTGSCTQWVWESHPLFHISIPFYRNLNFKESREIVPLSPSVAAMDRFVDKTGTAFAESSYIAYIPSQKVGVVLLFDKPLVQEKVLLGRTLLAELGTSP